PALDLLHRAPRAEHRRRAQALARPVRGRPRDRRWSLVHHPQRGGGSGGRPRKRACADHPGGPGTRGRPALARARTRHRDARRRPPPRPLQDLHEAFIAAVREKTRQAISVLVGGTPLARAAAFPHWRDFLRFFFYWFSDPLARTGPGLNYRARLQTARAYVLP